MSCSSSTTTTSSTPSRWTMRWPSWSSTCRPSVHLVIATREDPALPLARLRARGQLTELRGADLRFTPDEAAAFLNEVMDLDLSTDEIAALEARTEGWIAGLQLAAHLAAGPRRRRRLHRVVRRQPPLRARLPGRGGPPAAARTRAGLPAAHVHPRSAVRPALRCRAARRLGAPARRRSSTSIGRTCSSSPSTPSGAGTATTICSPICCGSGASRARSRPAGVDEDHLRASEWYRGQRPRDRGLPACCRRP